MRYKRLLMLGLMLGLPAVSQGAVLTFTMEGTISYVNDPLNVLDWINVDSDRMVYTFSFDSEAADMDSASGRGLYNGLSASLRVAGTPITVSAPTILIQHPLDLFDLQSQFMFDSYEGGAVLRLSDQAENNALTDVSLPVVPYDLEAWVSKHFDFGIDAPQPGYPPLVTLTFGGQIDSFYIVPEPATASLLLIARGPLRRRRS